MEEKSAGKDLLVKAGEGGSSGAKKEVWVEVVRKVGASKVNRIVVLPRGTLGSHRGTRRRLRR